MTKLLLFFAIALALHAEDAKPPTVEELTAQVAAKDQEIAQLKAELQRSSDQYLGCVVSRANANQQPALNPTQQRMMRQRPTPQPVKPKETE